MDDIVIVLNIGLENKYSNTVRCLSFSNSTELGETQIVIETHNDDELTEAVNQMRVSLSEYTQQAAPLSRIWCFLMTRAPSFRMIMPPSNTLLTNLNTRRVAEMCDTA